MSEIDTDKSLTCAICLQEFPLKDLFPLDVFQNRFLNVVRNDYPSILPHSFVCPDDFAACCRSYHRWNLQQQDMASPELVEQVLETLGTSHFISDNVNDTYEEDLSFADRMADRVSDFGGSWAFIISFTLVMVGWMVVNSCYLWKPFDAYPYILLNLVLSCVAALQAPIIMMSQKRQDKKDRLRAEQDYLVNLKAELEIRHIKSMLKQLTNLAWQEHHKKTETSH